MRPSKIPVGSSAAARSASARAWKRERKVRTIGNGTSAHATLLPRYRHTQGIVQANDWPVATFLNRRAFVEAHCSKVYDLPEWRVRYGRMRWKANVSLLVNVARFASSWDSHPADLALCSANSLSSSSIRVRSGVPFARPFRRHSAHSLLRSDSSALRYRSATCHYP